MAALTEIAVEMTSEAKARQVSSRHLPRGLRLGLVWAGGSKILTIGRPTVMPSETEISICRQAFGVPLEARVDRGRTSVTLRWAV